MGKKSSKKSKQANRGPPIGTSITTINNGSTLFLRSRLMEEQAFQKISECASLNNLSSTDSKEISRLLSFFLDEINDTNDETVQQLQQQIVDMSRIQDEQEEKMKEDREVIERWKGLVGKLGAKCRLLEMELKETKNKEISVVVDSCEVQGKVTKDEEDLNECLTTTTITTDTTTLSSTEPSLDLSSSSSSETNAVEDDVSITPPESSLLEDLKERYDTLVKNRFDTPTIMCLRSNNSELVQENHALVMKCQRLEKELASQSSLGMLAQTQHNNKSIVPTKTSTIPDNTSSSSVEEASQTMIIQDLQAENDALHQSMEEAMELASGMKELISYFAHTHEENTIYSQKKICQLQEELNDAVQSKDELFMTLYEVIEENQALRIEYEKAIQ